MYSNIVRIIKPDKNIFGSGIIICENKVLTAAHVVEDEKSVRVVFDKEYIGNVEYVDNVVALLSIEEEEFKDKYLLIDDKLLFTSNELFTDESKWIVEGYITEKLSNHRMEGTGIYHVDDLLVDYTLGNLQSGISNDYSGLSGSPVVLNGRAIGIIQIQQWDKKGGLGISFSSIKMFADKLPSSAVIEPMYICELKKKCYECCENLIKRNKEIEKYIPEIFVEESMYKENLRYFALPILFINKAIQDLKQLDFNNINKYLKKEKKQLISFSGYPEKVSPANFDDSISTLTNYLKKCIADIEELDTKRDGVDSIEEIYTQGYFINSSIKWDLKDLLGQMEYLDYRAMLLTRNAGQGKTNFVCDFTENFLLKKNVCSLFFNAADFCDTPVNILKKYITVDGKYSEKYAIEILNQWWINAKIPIVIVIDGLNENISLPNFENHILYAITEWLKLPFLKIIMTTRSELLTERFGKLTKENIGEKFSILDMSGKREDRFKKRIFDGYLNHFEVHIMKDTLLESTYELLANDTLLLRFFCEVNRGKKQVYMYDVYKYTLFESYYKKKQDEIKIKKIPGGDILFEQLVDHICGYMVESKKFNNIPREVLSVDEIQILNYLLEGDIVFKEDQIIKKGYLNEPSEVLSFTFDEFRDFCITRYLLKKDDALRSFPVIWDKMCNEHWGILEGVEKYLFYRARTDVPDILPIIEKNSNFKNMYWNNVWNLEDKDITDKDISLWREQFDCKGRYRRNLIKYLLVRRNKNYFKRVTIDLLFEFMDGIADKPGEFDDFIKTFFPKTKFDRFNQEIDQKECVFPCNQMVKALTEGLNNHICEIDYYTSLKLSIYLYGLMPKEIKHLWIMASSCCAKVIETITNEYLEKEYIPVVVKANLGDIYHSLNETAEEEYIVRLKQKCSNADIYQSTLVALNEIWGGDV